MRPSRHIDDAAARSATFAVLAVAALCGVIGASPRFAVAQDAGPEAPQAAAVLSDPEPAIEMPAPEPKAPPGSLKVLSWNVATSPYVIAMRKIKTSAPAWRTSFGSERRTIDAPPPPRADLIDADVVLLQGITNPRALRRLFPARKWRLIFSRRALETLPKGSVFTAPVSSVEVEAIAVRYRDSLRVVNRGEIIDDPRVAAAAPLSASTTLVTPPAVNPASPGLTVQVIDRGRTVWLASVTLDATSCGSARADCAKSALLARWRDARRQARDEVIAGGVMRDDAAATPCEAQGIEAEAPAAKALLRLAKGQKRDILGCVAELTVE